MRPSTAALRWEQRVGSACLASSRLRLLPHLRAAAQKYESARSLPLKSPPVTSRATDTTANGSGNPALASLKIRGRRVQRRATEERHSTNGGRRFYSCSATAHGSRTVRGQAFLVFLPRHNVQSQRLHRLALGFKRLQTARLLHSKRGGSTPSVAALEASCRSCSSISSAVMCCSKPAASPKKLDTLVQRIALGPSARIPPQGSTRHPWA